MIKLDRTRDQLTLVHENAPQNRLLVIGVQLAAYGLAAANGLYFADSPMFRTLYWAMVAMFALWSVVWTARYKQVLRTTTLFDLRGRRVTITSQLVHLLTQRQHTEGPVDIAFDNIEELRLSAKNSRQVQTTSLMLVMRDGRKRLLADQQRTAATEPRLHETAKLIEDRTGLGLNDTISPPRAVVLT